MPKRKAAHRGRYKAKSKPTAPTPLLLRRALAQLRGDPPESWPGAECGYTRQYPVPILAHYAPHLNESAARADLRTMIEGICRAGDDREDGIAWNRLTARCCKTNRDPGDVVLHALVGALAPVNSLNLSARMANAARVIEAARELCEAIEALRSTGQPIHVLMPQDPTALPEIADVARDLNSMAGATEPEPRIVKIFGQSKRALHIKVPSDVIRHTLKQPDVLLALVRHVSTLPVGTARQVRGDKWQRYALSIARRLQPLTGAAPATAIANAATGARITTKAITKNRN